MRDFIRRITPQFLLNFYRKRKKSKVNAALNQQKLSGDVISKSQLVDQFKQIGIEEGDVVLVHTSMSKIGYMEEGPKTFVDAIIEAVGSTGHVLMPNSPNGSMQLDYIRNLEVFDVRNDQSALGKITEYFRNLPEALRSENATEPVSCVGPRASEFVDGHFGEKTPYTSKSPFYKVGEAGGKILYVGVTLDNAGTSLHTLEDAVEDFIYPVYYKDEFNVRMKRRDGSEVEVSTFVHNPEQSVKRKCDGLIPLFEKEGVLTHEIIGKAETLVVDAKGFFDVMINEYSNHGVTMYTPDGIDNWKNK